MMASTALAQSGAQRMHDLLTAFAESGEYNVKKSDESPNRRSFYFTEVWGTDLRGMPPGTNIQKVFPQHLNDFFRAFGQYADEAIEMYFHDGTESDPMMNGLQVQWSNKDRNWLNSVQWPLSSLSDNIRLILFGESDDQRRLFVMTWEHVVSTDSINGETMTTIATTGTIEEFWGYKPANNPFVAPYQKKEDKQLPDVASTQAASFDELLAKVHRTCEIFRRESWNGRNAAAVVLHKLSDSYLGKLTTGQYDQLLEEIDPLFKATEEKGVQQLLGHTCYTLYKKSEHFQQPDSIPEMGHISTSTVAMGQKTKMVQFNAVMMNEGPTVTLKVKGRAPKEADKVSVARHPSRESVSDFPVENGRFEFTLTLPKDEVVDIWTSKNDPKQNVYVCADGQPLTIDLTCHSVKGSHQNEMLTDSLPLLQNADMDALRGIMATHRHDILSAFAVNNCYSELTLDELRHFLNDGYAYSRHPLLSPARQYANGLMKRIPGHQCPDAEVTDVSGVQHQLSQYTHGHDLTLLYFWSSDLYSTGQTDRLRRLHEQYPGLNIVTVAINIYPKHWRELVEQQKMAWTNLLAPGGWDSPVVQAFGLHALPECLLLNRDGIINGAPTNIDSAVRTVEALHDEIFNK